MISCKSSTRTLENLRHDGWYSHVNFEGVSPKKEAYSPPLSGSPFERSIYLPSNREAMVAFDLGAKEAENRRTLSPSWPFRCSAETMTQQFGSGCHVMLHLDEFFLRILLITELIETLVIFEGRM